MFVKNFILFDLSQHPTYYNKIPFPYIINSVEEYAMGLETQIVALSAFTIIFILGMMGYAYWKLKGLSANAPKSDTFEDDK